MQKSRNGTLLLIWLSVVLFVFSNAVALSLVDDGRLTLSHLAGPLLWATAQGVLFGLIFRYRPDIDGYILVSLSLLVGWSLILTDRLAPNFLARQISWVLLGTAVIGIVLLLPSNLNWLRRYRYTLLVFGLLLMATTFLFGVNPSGASTANYWLRLPFSIPVFFQPSELLKLLLVIFLASYFDEQEALYFSSDAPRRADMVAVLAPISLMGGFCLLLLVWQQDLGAATLFFILFLALFYITTGRRRTILGGVMLLILAGAFAYWQFSLVALRIDAWLNPWPDADGRAFQIVQSLYAIATGGVFGQGVGQGFPTYIPVVHSDFVFAAVAEEWGLVGTLTVTFAFMLLTHRGLLVAVRAKRPFHRYLAVGIVSLIAAQAILIMGGVTKLLPLTGVTLPLVSYGGSSMLITHIMIGLLLYLSAQQTAIQSGESMSPPQKRVCQLHAVFLCGFVLVALTLFFWGTIRAPNILQREDNPRQVERALRIERGAIYDETRTVLAETIGVENELTRIYPLGEIGPAVGYYSFRHGTSGAEDAFNLLLSGSGRESFLETNLLHRPVEGRSVRLTLNADLQTQANTLMNGRSGAVLLLREFNGAEDIVDIVVMGSYPAYNPNLIDEQFETLIDDQASPLLNRSALGQYQPGMILAPFVLATAVDQQRVDLHEPLEETRGIVHINGVRLSCSPGISSPKTWAETLIRRCPDPLITLGEQLGKEQLAQSFYNFGFTRPITLPLAIEAPASPLIDSPAQAAIGQDTLTITPLLLARAWIGLINNGRLPTMRFVSHLEAEPDVWIEQIPVVETPSHIAVSTTSAMAVWSLLPTLENGGVVYSGTAISGPDDSTNSWFLGQKQIRGIDYYVVIVLENHTDLEEIEAIGRELLEAPD